jgi:hypothetical protein
MVGPPAFQTACELFADEVAAARPGRLRAVQRRSDLTDAHWTLLELLLGRRDPRGPRRPATIMLRQIVAVGPERCRHCQKPFPETAGRHRGRVWARQLVELLPLAERATE